jgi:magnesium chelatase family protein
VLFLDEIAEFPRDALESLARVLDTGKSGPFPARPFHVIGAANPCDCGFAGSQTRACMCSATALRRHDVRLREIAALFGMKTEVMP